MSMCDTHRIFSEYIVYKAFYTFFSPPFFHFFVYEKSQRIVSCRVAARFRVLKLLLKTVITTNIENNINFTNKMKKLEILFLCRERNAACRFWYTNHYTNSASLFFLARSIASAFLFSSSCLRLNSSASCSCLRMRSCFSFFFLPLYDLHRSELVFGLVIFFLPRLSFIDGSIIS